MNVRFSLISPEHVPGGIALFHLAADTSDALDHALRSVAGSSVGLGRVALRPLCGIDEGLVARFSETSCLLMPHGGVGIVRELVRRLIELGMGQVQLDARRLYPEARGVVDAHALLALSMAPSSRAIALLLAQHERWGEAGLRTLPDVAREPAQEPLRHLLMPPTVALLGGANIGKSTLVNALSREGTSIVADEVGTTRDFVSVMVEVDGLQVRLVDTPGVREGADADERAACELALREVDRADLVLLCSTACVPAPKVDIFAARLELVLRDDARAQRGVSVGGLHEGLPPEATGLSDLARTIRRTLVPDEALESPLPWRFW